MGPSRISRRPEPLAVGPAVCACERRKKASFCAWGTPWGLGVSRLRPAVRGEDDLQRPSVEPFRLALPEFKVLGRACEGALAGQSLRRQARTLVDLKPEAVQST